jgi:ribosomal protein L11 methyltransferase
VIRLAVRVRREQAELVLAELLALTPEGVEEKQIGPETIEYAVYGAPGELPSLPDLDAVAGGALVEVCTSEIADDWQERWKRFHRPVLVLPPQSGGAGVPALHVRPPWEQTHGGSGVLELVIDPGQAFGTGAHATTRLCLELMLELLATGEPAGALLDAGTGSGVLAIAAAMLGFGPVLGFDNEAESVKAASENAHANGVAIETLRLDLRGETLPWLGAAELATPLTITANLLRPLLLDLARALERTGSRPANLIASGLLAEEVEEIAWAFAASARMGVRESRVDGEWAALWLAPAAQPASSSSVAAQTIER